MTVEEQALVARWNARWYEALRLWSPYLRLREPLYLWTEKEEHEQGLHDSFAVIRFWDTQVMVSLRKVTALGLQDHALSILAHEIGHHSYTPGDLGEHLRILDRMSGMLPGFEHLAPVVANLYTDLFINHRLKTRHKLPIEDVYRVFREQVHESRLMQWYLRIYELLWGLAPHTLAVGQVLIEDEGDAILASRIIRRFSEHPLQAAGRFAALTLNKLESDYSAKTRFHVLWGDTLRSAEGSAIPEGLVYQDLDPQDGMHPAFDPELFDEQGEEKLASSGIESKGKVNRNRRGINDYSTLLQRAGMRVTAQEVVLKYYAELASPHLIPFPQSRQPQSADPQLEGLDPWDVGRPLDKIDWLETLLRGPVVIPGVTTVERIENEVSGQESGLRPLLLDVYIDSSGSIPNPQTQFSPLCLAGAILSLSALRANSRVRVVLWSSELQGQVLTTDGFTRNVKDIFRVLTSYFGSNTWFPFELLQKSYQSPNNRPGLMPSEKVHLLVISDDGVETMLQAAEKTPEGVEKITRILQCAGGGASMVLNFFPSVRRLELVKKLRALGWSVNVVNNWETVIDFSREFSKRVWSQP